jgi:hypothetical protein
MECINATSLRRKSGQLGHPALVAGAGGSTKTFYSQY